MISSAIWNKYARVNFSKYRKKFTRDYLVQIALETL